MVKRKNTEKFKTVKVDVTDETLNFYKEVSDFFGVTMNDLFIIRLEHVMKNKKLLNSLLKNK